MILRPKPSSKMGRREAGFTMTEVVVTMAVIAVVTSFAVIKVTVARDHMTLTNAAREFANYTEKARLDSVRRHGDGGATAASASITLDSTTGYKGFLDYTYSGAPSTRAFTFPSDVTVSSVAVTTGGTTTNVTPSTTTPVAITFDWHGRADRAYRITFTNARGHQAIVGVTNAGEVSLDRSAITLTPSTYGAQTGGTTRVGP